MGKTFPRYKPLDEYPSTDKNDLNTWVEAVLPAAIGELIAGNGSGNFPRRISPGQAGTVLATTNAAGALGWQFTPTYFNVRDYGAKGDGSTDDSPAFQAAINAAIAAPGGTVYIPPGSGTYYNLAQTITIQPASGAQAWFSIEASVAPSSGGIRWSGGSNTQVFRISGWKYGHCRGVGVYVGTQDNVVIFDILQKSGVTSCGWVTWESCHHNLGTGKSNVAWRWGAALAGGEASFHHFRNCSVANGVSDNTKGHIGWLNFDGNNLANQWDNCGGSYLTYFYSAIGEAKKASAALDASQTTVALYSALGLPPTGRVKIDSEEIDYTGVSTNTLTGCTRGANSTTPATHVINSLVYGGTQNPLTSAWAYQQIGGGGHTFNGCGGSFDSCEFKSQRGVLTVNGGRWEVGRRLFESANGGSATNDATFRGVTFSVTTQPSDGISIALAQPGSFVFDSCTFYGSDFTAAAVTAGVFDNGGGPVAAGTLALRNCSIRGAAGDTFWTLTPSTWTIQTTGSYRTNTVGQFAQWLDGANAPAQRTVSGNQTLLARDKTVLVDSASAVATMTLPTAVNNKWQITVKRLSATNAVTLDGNGAETIDGAATKVLASQYAYLTVASDGTNVQIIAQNGTIT